MPKRKRKKDDGSKKEVKYKGVYKNKKRFGAQIWIDGKIHRTGTFDTPKEAAKAYDRAAIQAGRPTSKLNFLDQVPKVYKPKNNGLHPKNTTGFRGVHKQRNRFVAQITIGGKQQFVGTFGTAKEAAEAYDQAALQAKFPRSELNFSHAPKEETRIKKKKLASDNTLGFRGVCKMRNRFQAKIYIGGKLQSIGAFGTAKEAAIAWDLAAVQAKRPKSDLNFPFLHDYRVVEIIPKIKKRKIMR